MLLHQSITGNNMISTVHPYAQNTPLHHNAKTLCSPTQHRYHTRIHLLELAFNMHKSSQLSYMFIGLLFFDKFPKCSICNQIGRQSQKLQDLKFQPHGLHFVVLKAIMSNKCKCFEPFEFPLYCKRQTLHVAKQYLILLGKIRFTNRLYAQPNHSQSKLWILYCCKAS